MTPQELKNSIIQLAIQGKLVEQRPEEGTAEELYREIQKEKQALIKAGKIKKEKPLPEISEDEIPFEIPESWNWYRIGEVFNIVNGFTPLKSNPEFWTDGDIPWFTIEDVHRQGRFISTTEKFISQKALSKNTERIVPPDSVLLCCTASVGEYAYTRIPLTTNQQFNAFVTKPEYADAVFPLYVFEFAKTLKDTLIRNAGKTTFNFLSVGKLSLLLFPLPPLAEQKRIVAKIEELLPLIERYEKAWSRLEDFNKRFPGDMQKSILQMAIQGKLVEQRPEEGTGEELYQQIQVELKSLIEDKRFKGKKLPELSDDELPFEIPSSWKWVRLGDIISIESGKNLTSSQMKSGSVPVYGGNGITGYHDESLVHEETVVIGRVGFYCGSVHVTEKEAWITDNAFITTYPFMSIDRSFLVYILRHMDLGRDNNATAQPVVSGKKIYPLAFPLPPLAEQKRIVARLEEILPLCEALKR